MSQQNSVSIDPRELSIWKDVKKWLLPSNKNEAKTAFVFSDTDTPQELAKKLTEYSISYFAAKGESPAAVALDENDDSVYIIDARYNTQQNTILEDCYISDVVVHKLVDKLDFAVTGKHGKTVLDTRIEFPNEKERAAEIARINQNKKFKAIKAQIDDLFMVDKLDFHSNLFDLISNYFVFGRACFYIAKDESGMWTQLILLDSKRLGRVKVDKISRKIVAVEYEDVEVKDDGTMMPAIEVSTTAQNQDTQTSAQFLPIGDLIYLVNKAGGIGKNTKYVGYSLLEPIIHISQVKRIVINKNLKEAAETHYMGFGRYQFDPNTPDSLITNFINSVKGATGKYFGHKIPVQSFIEKMPVDLEKYNDVVDILNREMIRASGLASFLFGYEQIANYANSEQVNLASREIDIAYLKTMFKDIIAQKVLNPLVVLLSKKTDEEQPTALESFGKALAKDMVDNGATAAEDEETTNDKDKKPKLDPAQAKINDQYIKLTYEFEDLNFNTKKEAAEMIAIIKGLVPALPVEAILRAVGLDNWVEETLAEVEKLEKEKQENKEMMFEQFKNGQNNNGQQENDDNKGNNNNFNKPFNRNPAAVASYEDNPQLVAAHLDLIATQKKMFLEIMENEKKARNKAD